MINSDIYKLRKIENMEMILKNKLSSLIYHYNYRTCHFFISCTSLIALLINELGITMNLEIKLTKLIVQSAFGSIVRTDPPACVS